MLADVAHYSETSERVPRPRKGKSDVKVFLTHFLEYNGIVHHESLTLDRTINNANCIGRKSLEKQLKFCTTDTYRFAYETVLG